MYLRICVCVCHCDCDCDVLGLLVSVGVCLSGRGLSRGLTGAEKEDEEPSSTSDALQQSSGGGAWMCGDTRSPFDGVANKEHHLATAAKKKSKGKKKANGSEAEVDFLSLADSIVLKA